MFSARRVAAALALIFWASEANAQPQQTPTGATEPPTEPPPTGTVGKPGDPDMAEPKGHSKPLAEDKGEAGKEKDKKDKGPVLPASDGDDKRKQQDYGVEAPSQPGFPITILGRVVFFPFWLISEFVLRRPIGWAVVHAEKADLPVQIYDFFTFGEDHKAGIFPSAFFDFGLLPSVGFNAFWKEIGGSKHTANVHFGFWGPSWINVAASDSYQVTPHDSVFVKGSFIRRKDNPFFGEGTHSSQDNEVRYGSDAARAEIGYEKEMRQGAHLSVSSGFRSFGFKEGTCCSDDSLTDAIASKRLAVPTGFGAGYNAIFNRADVVVDTRRLRPQPGNGLRFEAYGEPTFTTDKRLDAGTRSWVSYGGSATGFVDLTGEQRVLSLTLDAQFVDPLTGQVPFPDQVTIGGTNLMRGYIRGRLVDRSAAVATLQYTWPVWTFFDGVLDASVGNVFDKRLENFTLDSNRLSVGLGIRSNSSNKSGFEILFAAGTEPFDQGAAINSFRFFVGGTGGI